MKQKNIVVTLIPLLLTFFVMGFVDSVGIATNYVKTNFNLSEGVSGFLPFMVFCWFLVFSIPTGLLMNKIGQKKTVLLSIIITAIALIVPFIDYSFPIMLVSFSLLGIGNTLMQVSLNPLLSNIISGKLLASAMTFGQFVKAIASFVAPIMAGYFAMKFHDWRFTYLIFAGVAVVSFLLLLFTKVKEQEISTKKTSSFSECFALFKYPIIVLSFLGIMSHVGLDVGINVVSPKLLMERLGMSLDESGHITSVYFLFRTISCFAGAVILAVYSPKKFFLISVIMIAAGIITLFVASSLYGIYAGVALIGLGNSNVFSIIVSRVLLDMPDKKNEVSSLMITGICGGAVFPLLMGFASDAIGSQIGAISVLSIAAIYLLFLFTKLKGDNK